ncbi:MAG: membrane protein insertase YidC [Pelomonas sp.]|nr:membrane protein insertase YidC [Roseateles sp.]
MTDIRRTVLWVVFTMSLFLLWDGWQRFNGHPSMFAPAQHPTVVAGAAPAGAASAAQVAAAAASGAASDAAPAFPREAVHVKTDVLDVTLDSLGGSVTRVALLKYEAKPAQGILDPLLEKVGLKKAPADAQDPVLLEDPAHDYAAQSGLVGAHGEQLPNHETPMLVQPGERTLKDGSDVVVVKMESAPVNGVKLVKTFTFKRGDYVVGVRHEVVNGGTAAVTPQLYLQLVRDGVVDTSHSMIGQKPFSGPAAYTEQSGFHTFPFDDVRKGKAEIDKTASDGWVAMTQHFFASVWLPESTAQRDFFLRPVATSNPADPQYSIGMVFTLPSLAPGVTEAQDDRLFVGPQEAKKLAGLAPSLPLVKDYGIFKILAQPLFWLLDQLHQLIGNWGWAIIALVVLLKAAFFWLNASAYRSMAKMKAIGPRIQALNERYKDKPQEKQQEMMRIYREEKVNPLGSCLPILVQMPFFMGLYSVLSTSVELRDAPWLGWIQDLSAHDPYFILPLIMLASQLFQVWLNPTPPDPVQAKMMWVMPLMFSVMFFVFPAGLVLYWLTNNILSIAQQWFINKQLGVANHVPAPKS